MLEEIVNDADFTLMPNDLLVKRIANMAEEQLRLERLILKAEADLADLTAKHKEISERNLPDLMAEVGVSAFSLTDGSKITVKPFYAASISDENRTPCHVWLETSGNGSLIKKTVTVEMEKGDAETFSDVIQNLSVLGVGYKVKEAVHPSTLNAFVKDQIQNGEDFPADLFKVFSGRKAKIVGIK